MSVILSFLTGGLPFQLQRFVVLGEGRCDLFAWVSQLVTLTTKNHQVSHSFAVKAVVIQVVNVKAQL